MSGTGHWSHRGARLRRHALEGCRTKTGPALRFIRLSGDGCLVRRSDAAATVRSKLSAGGELRTLRARRRLHVTGACIIVWQRAWVRPLLVGLPPNPTLVRRKSRSSFLKADICLGIAGCIAASAETVRWC